jgi:hypothetical protein
MAATAGVIEVATFLERDVADRNGWSVTMRDL